jgi:hypothetical protein
MLDAPKANRAKIAERRKEELRKLGLYYDFKGEFLQQITNSHSGFWMSGTWQCKS